MTEINWTDPDERLALIERVGVERYNALLEAHKARNTVSTVNRYPIQQVDSRFGRLFEVSSTRRAYVTLAEAEAAARTLPPRRTAQ